MVDYTLSPRAEVMRKLQEKGTAGVEELALYAGTNKDVVKAIGRDLAYRGRARCFFDEQKGGALVIELIG